MKRGRARWPRDSARFLLRPALLALLASGHAGNASAAAFTPGQAPLSVDTQAGGTEHLPDAYLLTLAPIRYWGVAAVDLRMRDVPTTGRTTGEVISGTVNAATYVWQPWFMQITGSLGLVAAADRSDQNGDTTSVGGIGSLNIGVFPSSRFPFNFYADVNDSRASGQVTDIDFRSYRMRVSQSYTPEFSGERYYGSYEYSRLTTINDGLTGPGTPASTAADDTLQVLRLGAGRSWQHQSLEGDISVSRNEREEADIVQSTRLDVANIRHAFLPSAAFALNTGLSYTRAAVDAPRSLTLGIDLPGTQTSSDFTQLVSFATYRPAPGQWLYTESNAFMATATFRAFDFGNEVDGAGNRSRGATGNLGLNYSLSPRTQLYSTTQLGYFTGDIEASSAAAQSIGIAYTADPIPWGKYRYQWTAGSSGSVGNISGGPNDGTEYLAQVTASHSLSRPLDLGSPGALVVAFSQGAGYSYGSESSGEGALTTTLTAFWNSPGRNGTQAFAGLTLSDARRLGDYSGYFQLANAQANLQVSLSRWSSLSTGLTFQATRSQQDREDGVRPFDPFLDAIEGDWRTSYGVHAMYTHVRAFGVPRLVYTGLLQANSFDLDSRTVGNVDAPLFEIDWLFENRLEYRIGKLMLSATVRWAEVENRGTSFLAFVRAQRTFGQF
jgi:hypothetical protein